MAEVVGRCNAFFVTHVMPPVLKNSADLIIIDDFGGGSGIGTQSQVVEEALIEFFRGHGIKIED